jgi:hypothetical protein
MTSIGAANGMSQIRTGIFCGGNSSTYTPPWVGKTGLARELPLAGHYIKQFLQGPITFINSRRTATHTSEPLHPATIVVLTVALATIVAGIVYIAYNFFHRAAPPVQDDSTAPADRTATSCLVPQEDPTLERNIDTIGVAAAQNQNRRGDGSDRRHANRPLSAEQQYQSQMAQAIAESLNETGLGGGGDVQVDAGGGADTPANDSIPRKTVRLLPDNRTPLQKGIDASKETKVAEDAKAQQILPDELILYFIKEIKKEHNLSPIETLASLLKIGLPDTQARLLGEQKGLGLPAALKEHLVTKYKEGFNEKSAMALAEATLPQILKGPATIRFPTSLREKLQKAIGVDADKFPALMELLLKGLDIALLRSILHFEMAQTIDPNKPTEVRLFYNTKSDNNKAQKAAERLLPLIFPEMQTE